jgi:uncharacterized repeat protein (TIGR03803 family)
MGNIILLGTADFRGKIMLRTISVKTRLIGLVAAVIFAGAILTQAQTFTVLYTLNGTTDGDGPVSGLVSDRQGNLYGTASAGGIYNCFSYLGCGTVFKLSPQGSGWTFSVLYSFTSQSDGSNPEAPLAIGADGSLYGSTLWGGSEACVDGGCGTIFKLSPPSAGCRTSCGWTKTILYEFTGRADGSLPLGQLTFDQAGNLYGTASASIVGEPYAGSVFELSPAEGGWTFKVLYSFPGGLYFPGAPGGGVVFDKQGNLWGVQAYGGADNCGDPQLPDPCGSIYELSPSSSGWTEKTVFRFINIVGSGPSGKLALDAAGNFYGTLADDGLYGGGRGSGGGSGGVYRFDPTSGQFTMLRYFQGNPANGDGPVGGVVLDQAGNLYAASEEEGTYHEGLAFEVSPLDASGDIIDLHNFTGGSDGQDPCGPLVVDAEGRVYGADLTNVIFQITPNVEESDNDR